MFAIDVQVGVPRFWTGAGITTFIIASWFLYEPIPGNDMRLSWITLIVGIVGAMLTYVVGMPSMVRTRFATPTIGREWMIGSDGRSGGPDRSGRDRRGRFGEVASPHEPGDTDRRR